MNKKKGPKYIKEQTPNVKYKNEIRKIFYMLQMSQITKEEYKKERLKFKIIRDTEILENLGGITDD